MARFGRTTYRERVSSNGDAARRLHAARSAALVLASLVGWLALLFLQTGASAGFSAVVVSVIVAVAGAAVAARVVQGLGAPAPARITVRRGTPPRPVPRACDPDRPGPVRPRAPGCGRA